MENHDMSHESRPSYQIRVARLDEFNRVREIEDEAGDRFSGLGLNDDSMDSSFPLDDLRRLLSMGQVWVACRDDDVPVGMVIASVREGAGYVEELDVVPAHGRRGLGTRLLAHVCMWAQAQGCTDVALSTFRDVPWNAPFYRKRGFRELSPTEWTAGMLAIREVEAKNGLAVDDRVFMRLELKPQ